MPPNPSTQGRESPVCHQLPRRVLLIGLDGATWRLLDRLVQAGRMPVLGGLIQNGVRGELESTWPPISPVAWTSLASGVYPGKHRVFGFFQPRFNSVRSPRVEQSLRPVNASDIGVSTLFETLNAHGRTTGLILVPVTHPPRPLDGYVVGDGILTPSEGSEYSWPSGLKRALLTAVPEFRVRPYKYIHHRPSLIDEITRGVEQQARGAQWLIKSFTTDFTMVVFTATDVVQHLFWKYLDPEAPSFHSRAGTSARRRLWRFFETVDRLIGELVAEAGSTTATMIVSDHGFTLPRRVFRINRWLQEQGLLRLEEGGSAAVRKGLAGLGGKGQGLLRLTRKLDVLNLRHRLPGRGRFAVGADIRRGIQRVTSPRVDWSRTCAYGGNEGDPYIYINLRGRDPLGIVEPGADYERVRAHICSELAQLRDPKTHSLVARRVFSAGDLYPGPYEHEAPDITMETTDPTLVTSDTVQAMTSFADDKTQRGAHGRQGMCLLSGAGIRKGSSVHGARIVDVMPTALHLLGVPVPASIDGCVLADALCEEFLTRNPVREAVASEPTVIGAGHRGTQTQPDEGSAEVLRRLRDLGYISG